MVEEEKLAEPQKKPINRSMAKAIRAKCLDCCCGSAYEVRLCVCEKCPLYNFRFGHRPKGEE